MTAGTEKLAMTVFAWLKVTVQVVVVPVQAPNQPWKVEPVVGATVRVIWLLVAKLAQPVAPVLERLNLLGRATVFRCPKFRCSVMERRRVN